MTPYCEGLGTGTFLAYLHHGQWGAYVVPSQITLSAADKATLSAISPSHDQPARRHRAYTRNLPSAGGSLLAHRGRRSRAGPTSPACR